MFKARITCLFLTLAILCAPSAPSSAQNQESIFERIRREHNWIEKGLHQESVESSSLVASSVESQSIDVKHYRLQIQLAPNGFGTAGVVTGAVTITGETTGTVSAINVDAQPNLSIDSVKLDGNPNDFRRKDSRVIISFPAPVSAGRPFTVVIQYHGPGTGSSSIGGGLLFTRHGPNFVPVIATHSEPFGAPLWWPCIDNPADKATAELEVTVPQGNQAASNGVLDRTQPNADGTVTYFWREDSPLTTYLVSVAATNYERFEDSYTALDGVTTMPLVYYVYPEHLELARAKFAVTRSAMQIYADLFGEYPFLGEKYGMAEFPFGGAMEHQTITSISSSLVGSVTSSHQSTIVHELAHQWWGDLVTMKTWDDIWLNEGFATYCEVLFFERFAGLAPGELLSKSYDDGVVDGALGGTVTAENLDRPFDDQGAIYRKGGWVLHMLRHVLGDQKFFDALKQYRERFAFSNASTLDFQRVCEEYYGASLDWFFQQWIYAPGRPVYKVTSDIGSADQSGNYKVTVVIKQKQSHEIPGRADGVYIMPLDVTIHYVDGTRETRTVWDDARKRKFAFTVAKQPVDVGVDEDHWVLRKLK
ncbi:MAG: M1 family metallopeptidase [Acidobacteriota bacterium]